MAEERKYSAAEVHEILRRAAEKSASKDSEPALAHSDLVAAAREAGIDPAEVERAAREVDAQRGEVDAAAELRAKNRRGFLSHLTAYVVVNLALWLFSLVVAGASWGLVPAIGWGIGLVFHLLSAMREPTREQVLRFMRERAAVAEAVARSQARSDERRAARAQKEAKKAEEAARKEQKRQQKEQTKEKLREASEAFESAVEQGVTAALRAAAVQIDALAKKADPVEPSPTDFQQYIQQKKGGPAQQAPQAPQAQSLNTGVRVDANTAAPSAARENVEVDVANDAAKRGTRGRT
jgi:hypothetical protein